MSIKGENYVTRMVRVHYSKPDSETKNVHSDAEIRRIVSEQLNVDPDIIHMSTCVLDSTLGSLHRSMENILYTDVVVMDHNWERCKRCRCEAYIAIVYGIQLIDLDDPNGDHLQYIEDVPVVNDVKEK